MLSVKKRSMLGYAKLLALPEKMCVFKHKKFDCLYLPVYLLPPSAYNVQIFFRRKTGHIGKEGNSTFEKIQGSEQWGIRTIKCLVELD